MTDIPALTEPKQGSGQFKPGQSGNPAGRPRGSRNKVTLAAEALLDGEAERLTRMAIEQALDGDPFALRLCLERILPPRRERPAPFAMPPLKERRDAREAYAAVVEGVAAGDLTPGEGATIARLLAGYAELDGASEQSQEIMDNETDAVRRLLGEVTQSRSSR